MATKTTKPKKKSGGKKKTTSALAKRDSDVIQGDTFEKELEVVVDPPVLSRKEKRLAKAMAEKRHEMDEINTKTQPHREEVKKLTKEIDSLVADIENGTEKRPVPCHELRDFKRNVIRTIREDTGKQIDERAMTAEDRELTFDDKSKIDGGDDNDTGEGKSDVVDGADDDPDAND